ncbi:MAG: PhzF family phenazine biosynthesis protein [Gammaproteobacteria bacterium]|jgi:PhzF family phenazine biosynthesis protein|nr:PhzF family phenazine biosynthesis protein [Gammaproteobacteria bacterium]MDH3757012.1 PhzF family phenazine biosynthesis protein [Gammaproteobacteria bacterium]MDH3847792.1 PhzF family phenazine biosynthesis protein [Gammaproteobacteria bacterium]MDH3862506.1 PhzF family phenazine biosynthesis protein [Gammaproteobacteria bacterium]MDH3904634.1 PhzF family phenazine biosynthesis protein [Gammaproteobacteria bacterium]
MTPVVCLQIDAFADRPYSGNPAAVCLLDEERDSQWMQAVAREMNLSETAFVRPTGDGFDLRWFTPAVEVDLCGHATLAAAHALWSEGRAPGDDEIRFQTRSGVLTASRRGGLIELDFPATAPGPAQLAAEQVTALCEALGVEPDSVARSVFDLLVVVGSEDTVRGLRPDFARLKELAFRGVIVTSVSDDPGFDFVSRFFAPGVGIDEDPVTGSAHCCLGPYWSERLGKTSMTAFQVSSRGGVVHVRVSGDRVLIRGDAVTVFKGKLTRAATG